MCFNNDEEKSQFLIIRPIFEYRDLTCLQVAVSAEAFTFIGHLCTQALLTKIWYDKILSSTSEMKVSSIWQVS